MGYSFRQALLAMIITVSTLAAGMVGTAPAQAQGWSPEWLNGGGQRVYRDTDTIKVTFDALTPNTTYSVYREAAAIDCAAHHAHLTPLTQPYLGKDTSGYAEVKASDGPLGYSKMCLVKTVDGVATMVNFYNILRYTITRHVLMKVADTGDLWLTAPERSPSFGQQLRISLEGLPPASAPGTESFSLVDLNDSSTPASPLSTYPVTRGATSTVASVTVTMPRKAIRVGGIWRSTDPTATPSELRTEGTIFTPMATSLSVPGVVVAYTGQSPQFTVVVNNPADRFFGLPYIQVTRVNSVEYITGAANLRPVTMVNGVASVNYAHPWDFTQPGTYHLRAVDSAGQPMSYIPPVRILVHPGMFLTVSRQQVGVGGATHLKANGVLPDLFTYDVKSWQGPMPTCTGVALASAVGCVWAAPTSIAPGAVTTGVFTVTAKPKDGMLGSYVRQSEPVSYRPNLSVVPLTVKGVPTQAQVSLQPTTSLSLSYPINPNVPDTEPTFTTFVRRVTVGPASGSALPPRIYGPWQRLAYHSRANPVYTVGNARGQVWQVYAEMTDVYLRVGRTGTPSVAVPVDSATTTASLSRGWAVTTRADAVGGSVRTTSTKGAALVATPAYASTISVIGPRQPQGASFAVYVDGVLKKTVSTNASTYQPRMALATLTVPFGKHTVRVVTTSAGKFGVDAFAYSY